VFTVADCATQFNGGFNDGFNAGFNPGWRSEFSQAYRPKGAWQVGWQRGFVTGRHQKTGHVGRQSALTASPAAVAQARPAAAVGCDVVLNFGIK